MLTVDLVITRAHVHRFVRFFAFAAHQDIVELIELRLANLLLHLTIRDVDFREMTGLAELALDLVAVVSRGFRDRHNHDLFWRQPIRPLTRKVLGQNREHTLDRTEDSSVNDDRPHRRVVFVDVRQVNLLFIIALLVMSQPDLGSTAIICLLVVAILFYAGISFFQFSLLSVLILLLGYLAVYSSPWRIARVMAFTDPFAPEVINNSGWQLSNSLIGIGQGGWFGLGLGNSFQKNFFLPEAHTDFIFAIIVEELGVIGGLFVLFLFVILFIGILRVVIDSLKKGRLFQGYSSFGIFVLIAVQALFNIAVNIGLLPTKGLTLPFISYGGTSIIIMMCLIAIVLRINHENKLI